MLLICLASGRTGVESGLPELHDLLRATHLVRAMVTEAREDESRSADSGHAHREEALVRLAETGSQLPRWALIHALAEEHERLGWREDDTGRWHRKRAACLYGEALASPALAQLPPHDFSALFNRTAFSMRRLMPHSNPAKQPPGLAHGEALKEQEEQCAATMVEYERWKGKRDDVINFALGSAFHPLRWLSADGLSGKRNVHIEDVRRAFRDASLHSVMRPVVEQLWQDYSPDAGGGAATSLAANTGADLREVLAAVGRWRSSSSSASPSASVGGADVRFWDEMLRACAIDGPTTECFANSALMTEADLDQRKSQFNSLHVQLNARKFPVTRAASGWRRGREKVLPIWLRVCQRTDPLGQVLQQLKMVGGIQDAVLLVSVDRDLIEPVLLQLANHVDYMHVRIYLHPYTRSRSGLGFHGWDTGVHRLNSHYLFGLRLALLTLDFGYVITLEDDLVPSPDFLSFHKDLSAVAESDRDIAAILAYPNGPLHDCHFIAPKLSASTAVPNLTCPTLPHPPSAPPTSAAPRATTGGKCAADAADRLYSDDFFAGWGGGIPRHTFYRFLPAWNFSGIYDGILNGLLGDGVHALAPCQPRVRIAINTGLHGVSHERWDHWLYHPKSSSPTSSTPSSQATSELPSHVQGTEGGGWAGGSRGLGYKVLLTAADDLGGADHDEGVDLAARAQASGWEEEEETEVGVDQLLIVTQEMAARFANGSPKCHVAGSDGVLLRGRGDGTRISGCGGGGTSGAVALAKLLREDRESAVGLANSRREADGRGKVYRVWSSDFHVGPISDLKEVWSDLRVHGRRIEVIDKSLSGSCASMGTCARGRDLRVLNQSNGQDLLPDPAALIAHFAREYKEDAEMQSVDAVVCSHPAAMCEVFEPLNKSLLVYATTRYEMGRCFSDAQQQGCSLDPSRWRSWSRKLERWAGDRRHVISANNLYDARYIRHFTGVPAQAIANYCDKGQSYRPVRRQILLSMAQHVENALWPLLQQAVRARGAEGLVEFAHIRRLYRRYEYSDLAQHPAIVVIPYQVSVMSFFEQYRLNVPLLLPSRRLLASWSVSSGVVQQRTWASVFGQCSVASALEPHAAFTNETDPNNDYDEDAVFWWLRYADYYTFPHILYWDSPEQLVDLAAGRVVDLAMVHVCREQSIGGKVVDGGQRAVCRCLQICPCAHEP